MLPTPRVGGTGVNGSEMRRNSPNLETTITLLPTPGKADGDGGHLSSDGHQATLPGVIRDMVLLPSPRTSDTNGAGHHGDGGPDLRTAVADLTLLPTPAVNDMGAAYTPETWDAWTAEMKDRHANGNGHGKSLNVEVPRMLPTPTTEPLTGNGHARHLGAEVQPSRWGDYGPAIRRHEQMVGRPAPSPTKPNAKGNPKLSDEFDEWLMGLPAGWITDVPDIGWNEVLKACGNGVVPQQAEAAIRWLWQWLPATVRTDLQAVAS